MAKSKNIIGSWAFLIGLILAVLVGLFSDLSAQGTLYTLVILGLIVGLLNVADEEAGPFLLSGAVLIIASSMGSNVLGTIPVLKSVLNALLALFVPAIVIVAIRNVFAHARH